MDLITTSITITIITIIFSGKLSGLRWRMRSTWRRGRRCDGRPSTSRRTSYPQSSGWGSVSDNSHLIWNKFSDVTSSLNLFEIWDLNTCIFHIHIHHLTIYLNARRGRRQFLMGGKNNKLPEKFTNNLAQLCFRTFFTFLYKSMHY